MKISRWTAAVMAFLLMAVNIPAVYANASDSSTASDSIIAASVDALAFTEASAVPGTGEVQGKQALMWREEVEWIEWEVTVPEAGEYTLELEYCPLADTGMTIHRGIWINGETQHADHENAMLDRFWVYEGERSFNSIGDEVSPMQTELLAWRSMRFMDGEGLETTPLVFSLKQGVNTIRMTYVSEEVAIRRLSVLLPEKSPAYSECEKEYRDKGYKDAGQSVRFEAEDALTEKNSSTIFQTTDNEPSMTPANDDNKKINMVGGWNVAASATWTFTVPETGLYTLYLRDNVSAQDGMDTYCTIRVDGKVPFEELWEYPLSYQSRWRTEVIAQEDGTPMKFYLEAGKEHTLTLRTVCGPLREQNRIINEDYLKLTKLIRDIIKITGSSPDVNYDYQITTAIPDIVPRLQELAENMETAEKQVGLLAKNASRLANQMHSIAVQLRELVEKPDTIPRRLTDLQTLTSSYASVVGGLKSGAFSLDSFWLTPPEDKIADYKSSFFQKVVVFFRDFFLSFIRDYSVQAEQAGVEETIEVWVSRGKEWAEIIQRLSDTYFTPEKRIGVRINVLPTGQLNAGGINPIMLAIAAGTEPDVALGVSGTSPFEYAIRNAAADLSVLDDFDKVYSRFQQSLFVPMTYNQGIYGLPETMNLRVMYYRTDIFDELGLTPPDTWDEVYNTVLPLLYKNGMEMSIPNMYDVFLYQNGGSYYTEDGLRSGLDSREAYLAFSELISLYTDYGIPVAMNFFNRFRTGEAPIGIDTVASYMTYKSAAPEIAGRWAIAPIPGKVQENGEINRSYAGMLTESCFILESTDKKDAAWEFLKWWTSDDMQTQFQREVESRMGTQARWLSANTAAFDKLAWSRQERETLGISRKWGSEAPQVIGGYFSGRHITNAFTRCVVDGDKPRDSLEKCVEDINMELIRRQKDFHIES